MYLPSNVSSSVENTMANYVTELPENLVLSSAYEVGIAEVSYTYSWFNIPEDQVISYIDSSGRFYDVNIVLKKGHYSTIEPILYHINRAADLFSTQTTEFEKPPRLFLRSYNPKIVQLAGSLKTHPEVRIYFDFPQFLNEMLGLPELRDTPHIRYDKRKRGLETIEKLNLIDSALSKSILNIKHFEEENELEDEMNIQRRGETDQGKHYSIVPDSYYQMNAGINAIFVYSDLVEHSIVGNSKSQLLRIVEIPRGLKFGQQVLVRYDKINYIPLLLHQIHRIQIYLKDDSGEVVGFNFGRVFVTLHFRKVNNNNNE